MVPLTAAFCRHFHPVCQEARGQAAARRTAFVRYVGWARIPSLGGLCPQLPQPSLPTKAGGRDHCPYPSTDQWLSIIDTCQPLTLTMTWARDRFTDKNVECQPSSLIQQPNTDTRR